MLSLTILLKSLWDIRIPFSQEVKYSILALSVVILLLALCVLIWQICRYCTRRSVHTNTVKSSLLYPQAAKNGTLQNSQVPDYQLESLHDEVEPLSRWQTPSSNLSGSTDSLLEVDEDRLQGSLRFSLFYDQQQSCLVVTMLEAQGLAVQEFIIHVRVLLQEIKKEEQKLTGVLDEWTIHLLKNSCNSSFRATFSSRLTMEEVPRATVRLEVKDFDKHSRHNVLGEVRVSLNGLNILDPLEILEDLQRPKKDIVGEVLLSLKYMPTCHRLEVGILKIRTVFSPINMERALYVRTRVLCNQCRTQHHRTAEKTRWPMTVFNEIMVFELPETHISECKIMLSVCELHSGKKIRCLVGQLAFGKLKNEEDEHWKLMMRLIRQPVAHWHLLYL